jgi:hypothetical protein
MYVPESLLYNHLMLRFQFAAILVLLSIYVLLELKYLASADP